MQQPTLKTQRLTLRPFEQSDAQDVQHLAGDNLVAKTTAHIPHPYPDGAAEGWIALHRPSWEQQRTATFAICVQESSKLVGAISLMGIGAGSAELGY